MPESVLVDIYVFDAILFRCSLTHRRCSLLVCSAFSFFLFSFSVIVERPVDILIFYFFCRFVFAVLCASREYNDDDKQNKYYKDRTQKECVAVFVV